MDKNAEKLLVQVLDRMVDKGCLKKDDGMYIKEIYVDSDARFSSETLKKISNAEDFWTAFDETILEIEELCSVYESYTMEDLLLTEEEKQNLDETEVNEWLQENIVFTIPENHYLDQTVKVNMILASEAETNSDFGEYMCLNTYGEFSGEIGDDNALMWVARQFGKETELKTAVKITSEADEEDASVSFDDPFIQSCVQELLNFTHVMGAFTFLLEMPLRDFLKIRGMDDGEIVIEKDVMCGLFNPWVGGGSILEIELPENLTIPADMIWSVWIEGSKKHGYDLDEVFGLVSSCWKNCSRMAA